MELPTAGMPLIPERQNRPILERIEKTTTQPGGACRNHVWQRAYIGLGANLGPKLQTCLKALDILSAHPRIRVHRRSSFYETEPMDIDTPYWFLNAVAEISTELSPFDLLQVLLKAEKDLGRDRSAGHCRTIDLDLLYFGDIQITHDDLRLPHPRLRNRRFVLAPWAELTPDLYLYPWRKRVSELLAQLPVDGPVVRKAAELKAEGI
jgi:2-amino-4-hydroxy-6-hydroxymethyldihydropteridine diphosphokinase